MDLRSFKLIINSICIMIVIMLMFPRSAMSEHNFTNEILLSVITVGPDQTYTTIQSAIDASNPGDTIYVHNGTYYETIQIDTKVNVIGNGSFLTLINGTDSGDVVSITANGCSITGIGVIGSPSYSGIKVTGDNLKIDGCGVGYNRNGITLVDSQNSKISNCSIMSNTWNGTELKGLCTDTELSVNSIWDNNECGVWLSSHDIVLKDNMISSNLKGIEIPYLFKGSEPINKSDPVRPAPYTGRVHVSRPILFMCNCLMITDRLLMLSK